MRTPFSHFAAGSILKQAEHFVSYKLNLSKGEGSATIYPLLHGVEVIEISIQAPCYVPVLHQGQDILEINLCLEGRAECQMSDGCFQYIGEQDLFISTLHNHSESIELPLGYYCGLVMMIDISQAGNSK